MYYVDGRMDRQMIAAVLKNYWLCAGNSHEPVTGIVPLI